MNTAAISVLAEAGIHGREAEVQLRRLLSDLVAPTASVRQTLEKLGVAVRDLDPSHNSIPEIVRRLADAGLDESTAREIFDDESVPAMMALVRRVERLEQEQGT